MPAPPINTPPTDPNEELFDDGFVARLRQLRLAALRQASQGARGERHSSVLGSGLEFADRREYAAGDDIRRLDWALLARSDQTQIKLYQEDRELPLRIAVDTSASMLSHGASKLRQALRLAAALAHIGANAHDQVAMMAWQGQQLHCLRPSRDRARLLQIFGFLKSAPRGGGTHLRRACESFVARYPRPGIAVVISDFYDMDGAFQGLGRLAFAKHDVICLQVLDRDECQLDPEKFAGRLALVAAEDEAHQIELEDAEELLEAYREAHEAYCDDLARRCRARGIRYVRAWSQQAIETVILRDFRRAGVLA